MNNELGFTHTFTGKVRGVSVEDKSNKDKTKAWTESYLHVEGDSFKTYKFRFTRDAIQHSTIYSDCEKLVDKHVTFECYSLNRVWQDKIYTDHFFKGSVSPTTSTAVKAA